MNDTTKNTPAAPAVGAQVEREVMQHTHGPWCVVVEEHPHHFGGTHVERRIFTMWDHPQLKGPLGVVNMSVGIGPEKDSKPRHMVSLSAADAALIAAAPEMLAACLEVAQGYSTRGAELARLALAKWRKPVLHNG